MDAKLLQVAFHYPSGLESGSIVVDVAFDLVHPHYLITCNINQFGTVWLEAGVPSM